MSHINELIDYIVAIYLVKNRKVLLCNHIKLGMWVPIGGHIELDEQPIQALKREILEETGYTEVKLLTRSSDYLDREGSQLPAPTFLDHHNFLPKTNHWHTGFIYVGSPENGEPILAAQEHKELRWFTGPEVFRLENTNESIRRYSIYAIGAWQLMIRGIGDWKTEDL